MTRRILLLISALALLVGMLPAAAQTSADTSRLRPVQGGGSVDMDFGRGDPNALALVFVQFTTPSVARFSADRIAATGNEPSQGQQLAQADAIANQHTVMRTALSSFLVELRSEQRFALNGFTAMVKTGDIPAISRIPGVLSVLRVKQHYPDHALSLPAVGAPTVWGDFGFTGDGLTVAVIDSGIDYHHATFGGSGNPAHYAADDGLTLNDAFPNAKVISGWDFVGDDYDASSDTTDTPDPDPNPLDCATGNAGGHGTHVAGTVGGYGVLANGNTFTGAYNSTTFTANEFLVGPGVAPEVYLVALRVFGCSGSSAVVHEAIDWAVRYNTLFNPIDVINMSLGSGFGETTDPSAIAAQNAAESGIIVVAASGNAGNIPYITGSPAVSPAVISVAGSIAGGTIDVLALEVLSSSAAGSYPMEPAAFGASLEAGDVQGTLVEGLSTTGIAVEGCGPLSNAADVAGNVVLLRRGTCPFVDKYANSVAAGAIGLVVYNNTGGPPTVMGGDAAGDIPAVMVANTTGATLLAAMAEEPDDSVEPTVGAFDPNTGEWHLRDSAGNVTTFYFGNPGDMPMVGDWNGDGVDTVGLYRQSDGFVYLRNSNTAGIGEISFFFGNPGDIPLAGDWNGNGFDTVSLYRPSTGQVFIINALGENGGGLGPAEFSFYFGNPGDKPFAGDFNGNGVDSVGLHRESTGLLYFRNSLTQGVAEFEYYFGNPGDRLFSGDFGIVDLVETAGVFRPGNATWYFRHTHTQGNADSQFVWGQSHWLPVAGNFGFDSEEGGVEVLLSADSTIPLVVAPDEPYASSSRGPGRGGSTFKPEVTAPAVNVESADVGTGTGGVRFSGTSMATPHVAGIAAMLREAHPDASPAIIKSLMMNSGRPLVPENLAIARQAGGIVQANVAVQLNAYTSPGGVAFGRLNPITGGSFTQTVTVNNMSGAAQTFGIAITRYDTVSGVTVTAPATIDVAAGSSASFDLTMTLDPAAMPEDNAFQSHREVYGAVMLTGDTDDLRLTFNAVVDAASNAVALGADDGFGLTNVSDQYSLAHAFTSIGGGGDFAAIGAMPLSSSIAFFGFALDDMWEPMSGVVMDLWLDVDQDGTDDYLVRGVDLGVVTTGAFSGQYVSVFYDLGAGTASAQFFAEADFNDRVMGLFISHGGALSGEMDYFAEAWNIRSEETIALTSGTFNMDTVIGAVFVDIEAGDVFSGADLGPLAVPGILWLFPNNPLGTQSQVTTPASP